MILHTAQGDADIVDKEMQIIHKEFIMEKSPGSSINNQNPDSEA